MANLLAMESGSDNTLLEIFLGDHSTTSTTLRNSSRLLRAKMKQSRPCVCLRRLASSTKIPERIYNKISNKINIRFGGEYLFETILKLNWAGRRYLKEDATSRSKCIAVLAKVKDDINCLFFHLKRESGALLKP